MSFRFDDRGRRLTRHDLADAARHETLEQRLRRIGAIDLRDNFHVVEEQGGYIRLIPADEHLTWDRDRSAGPGPDAENKPSRRRGR